ncbi:MAG: SO_0444 family Cu/Zn efflux transporter [Shewanella sp.]
MLLKNFIDLFLDSAPWLLLGLTLAGLLKVFVPMAWMQKQLGGHGIKAVLKAAILGAPLPLCSCGVIPAAVGLRRSGASKAATTSFLVSTPETGVDSIAVSYVLLGPFMAIVRPIAAICSAIVAGLLVGRDDDDIKAVTQAGAASDKALATDPVCASQAPAASCCASQSAVSPARVSLEPTNSCCAPTTALAMAPVKASCCGNNSGNNSGNDATQTAKPTLKLTPMATPSLMTATPSLMTAAPNVVAVGGQMMGSEGRNSPVAAQRVGSCCGSQAAEPEKVVVVKKGACCASTSAQANDKSQGDSCCASTQDIATELKSRSILSRIGSGLHYAATDLVRDTTLWLLVGLFFAALVQTYVPTDFLVKWGNGMLAMVVMVLVSIPMYICATASTPIAAGLLLAGVSPGAVLVFMLAGPATNIATLGVVTKELGKRALFGYLGGVIGVAFIAGLIVNYLVATFGFVVMPQLGEEHHVLPHGLMVAAGVLLALLMAKAIFEKIPRSVWRRSDCCS